MKTQEAKTYTLNVAKMLAGKMTKNTGEKHLPVNVGEDKWEILSESAFAARVEAEAKAAAELVGKKKEKKAKVKALYVSTLPLATNATKYEGWIGAVEPNGRVTWFDSKMARVDTDAGMVTVKVPYSMAKTRKSVQWEIEEIAA